MSQTYPAPMPNEKSHASVAPNEIAVGVVIGRTSEYFDFFVYGIASVLIFPQLFFPFTGQLQGMLYSFMLFALALNPHEQGGAKGPRYKRQSKQHERIEHALQLAGKGEKQLREDQYGGDAVDKEVEILGGTPDDHAHGDLVGGHGSVAFFVWHGSRIGLRHVVRSSPELLFVP
ncbi:hypothetical protein A3730_28020 [Alcanivorax sp. HI0044]|nr:hypothetical protein A3730_28020 [Alcanivorax sp. HI0044]